MFFRHSISKRIIDPMSDGSVREFPESLVNPLYKPKTLGELKAQMVHTGINPAPAPTRPGLPETPGVDSMDSPPIPVTGDTFEIIRAGQQVKSQLAASEKELADLQSQDLPPQEPPATE